MLHSPAARQTAWTLIPRWYEYTSEPGSTLPVRLGRVPPNPTVLQTIAVKSHRFSRTATGGLRHVAKLVEGQGRLDTLFACGIRAWIPSSSRRLSAPCCPPSSESTPVSPVATVAQCRGPQAPTTSCTAESPAPEGAAASGALSPLSVATLADAKPVTARRREQPRPKRVSAAFHCRAGQDDDCSLVGMFHR